MRRRALIVVDVVLAALFAVAGLTNLVIGGGASIIAGLCSLAVAAACAVTAVLFIAAGGWSRERPSLPDTNRRAYVRQTEGMPERQ
jgi:membrane protein implicated in regulation of membrane protease activity